MTAPCMLERAISLALPAQARRGEMKDEAVKNAFEEWSVRHPEDALLFFFSSRRRHTRFDCHWSSDVCSSDLKSAAIKLDPKTGKATRLVQYAGGATFEGSTTSLEVGDEVWMGSFKGDRIARLPVPKK